MKFIKNGKYYHDWHTPDIELPIKFLSLIDWCTLTQVDHNLSSLNPQKMTCRYALFMPAAVAMNPWYASKRYVTSSYQYLIRTSLAAYINFVKFPNATHYIHTAQCISFSILSPWSHSMPLMRIQVAGMPHEASSSSWCAGMSDAECNATCRAHGFNKGTCQTKYVNFIVQITCDWHTFKCSSCLCVSFLSHHRYYGTADECSENSKWQWVASALIFLHNE
jgi:hypothetical protein